MQTIFIYMQLLATATATATGIVCLCETILTVMIFCENYYRLIELAWNSPAFVQIAIANRSEPFLICA